MRLIDADKLARSMYEEAMIKDSDMQKWDSGCWIRYKLFENVLDAQPTIEPERNNGKWIEVEEWTGDVYYDCSACGNSWTTIDGTPWDNGMKFCPNCGARMDGES